MKRSRPKQHYRVIKTKKGRKRITINKGRRKRCRSKKNYGFMSKSTDWPGLAQAARAQKEKQDIKSGPGGIEFVQARLDPYEVLAFIDLNKGIPELRSKGGMVTREQERLIKQYVRTGELSKAHALLPPKGKMFANLALNVEAIAEQQKEKRKSPKTIRPRRLAKQGSLPSLNKSNTMSFEELDKWLADNQAKV